MLQEINENKIILVLGGLGFIGQNLVEELWRDKRYNIIIFDKSTRIGPFAETDCGDRIKYYSGDINDIAKLERIFSDNHIDGVIHLASTTTPASAGGENIVFDIESNLIPTVRLLNLMKEYGCEKIVFASSGGTVYGSSADVQNSNRMEHSNCNPICSHGIIKLSIEKYMHLYQHLYGINYLILRISNPFGEHHQSENQGLINVALKNIVRGRPVTLWGDGEIVRDFIYIKDCIGIIKQLMDKEVMNEVVNIGHGVGRSVNEVLGMIRHVTGDFEIQRESSRKFDVPYAVLDIGKLSSLVDLNFTNMETAIGKTYNWVKNHSDCQI